jgi:hypothetical protein
MPDIGPIRIQLKARNHTVEVAGVVAGMSYPTPPPEPPQATYAQMKLAILHRRRVKVGWEMIDDLTTLAARFSVDPAVDPATRHEAADDLRRERAAVMNRLSAL